MRLTIAAFFFVLLLQRAAANAAETEVLQETATDHPQLSYQPEFLTGPPESGDLFGSRTGYLHPFLSVAEYYTDNQFNVPEGEEEDFITVISPGIWAAFPAGSRQPLRVSTLNSAPGGLEVTRFAAEGRRRLQGYALYRADITEHKNFSEEDKVYQRAEGLAKVSFRGGLSLELVDVFEIDQDPYGTGVSRQLDEFTSNLLQCLAEYRISPKTRVRGDLGRYSLEYEEERNAFREREDLTFSLYFFYRMLPKTSVLLQYDLADIDYEEELVPDSREHRVLTGFFWDVTAKSRGTVKVGYGTRDVDGGDDRRDVVGEVRLDHRFTPKTSAYAQFTRRVEETDIQGTQNVLSHRVQVGYRQRLAPWLNGTVALSYYRDSYRGDLAGGQTDERQDDYYGARLGAGYQFRRWLNFGLGYHYLRRDSNFSEFDYTNNTVYLTVTAAL